MIYLVSGLHRSGTSMMVRCLEAGGLSAVYDSGQDELNLIYGDNQYMPNPNGFYAIGDDGEFSRPDFVIEHDGKLLKCPYNRLLGLPRHLYRLIFLLRDPQEIRASMNRFMPDGFGMAETITWFYDDIFDELLAQLRARGDMDIKELQYADIVAKPLQAFASLDWPIDSRKSTVMVQAELYRFRIGTI